MDVNKDQERSEENEPYFRILEVPDGVLPDGVVVVGDFTEFERARSECREVNWSAFALLRDLES